MLVVKQSKQIICDLCLDSLWDLYPSGTEVLSTKETISLASTYGAEIEDHLCEEVEGSLLKYESCVCGCKLYRKDRNA